jgi:hypothetical protein
MIGPRHNWSQRHLFSRQGGQFLKRGFGGRLPGASRPLYDRPMEYFLYGLAAAYLIFGAVLTHSVISGMHRRRGKFRDWVLGTAFMPVILCSGSFAWRLRSYGHGSRSCSILNRSRNCAQGRKSQPITISASSRRNSPGAYFAVLYACGGTRLGPACSYA